MKNQAQLNTDDNLTMSGTFNPPSQQAYAEMLRGSEALQRYNEQTANGNDIAQATHSGTTANNVPKTVTQNTNNMQSVISAAFNPPSQQAYAKMIQEGEALQHYNEQMAQPDFQRQYQMKRNEYALHLLCIAGAYMQFGHNIFKENHSIFEQPIITEVENTYRPAMITINKEILQLERRTGKKHHTDPHQISMNQLSENLMTPDKMAKRMCGNTPYRRISNHSQIFIMCRALPELLTYCAEELEKCCAFNEVAETCRTEAKLYEKTIMPNLRNRVSFDTAILIVESRRRIGGDDLVKSIRNWKNMQFPDLHSKQYAAA